MKFQGSKSEIEAPESKTDILHCKMYVFFNFGMNFQCSKFGINFKVPNLKFKPQSPKHTFYTVKCMFFQFWNEISRFQAWNLSPSFEMKFQDSKPEIEAPESKTYILHCKMYVFPILDWNFKIPNLRLNVCFSGRRVILWARQLCCPRLARCTNSTMT